METLPKHYYPRMTGILRAKLDCLAYNPEVTDLLRDFRDWPKLREIARKMVEDAEKIAREEEA